MAGNLSSLAKNLRKRADELPKTASALAVKIAETIVGDLAHVTPVDTSQAISNWQTELNTPADAPIGPHYPGEKGSTYSASARETIDRAKATLKNKQPGEPIYLSNVLRYIKRLNEGSSSQAPAGFVERAVLLGRLAVEKTKLFR
jgi:hypothetical protein